MTTCIGHRGAAGHEPENTLRSFARAIELGADLVEMDVQLTRDGRLVVMHDKRVDRTTTGTGYVAEMSLDELRRLDAGKGERVPTLEEVAELASGRVGMMVEIITPGIARRVVEAVGEGFRGQLVYASFLHAEVAEVRRVAPRAETLALIEAVPVRPTNFARDAAVTHVGISLDSVTEDFIRALREDLYKVFVYTANDPRDVRRLQNLGVDGIISDYPELLRDASAARAPRG